MMSESFDPADPAAWIAHGRSPEHAAALADAWCRFPDLPNDFPADQRMARMRERVTALRPVMESMARVVEHERQDRNFAFTERRVTEGEEDDRDRAILRARDVHGYDWDQAVRYAAGWFAAHAGWEPECRRAGPLEASAQAYDHGFRDGGGNRDDLFDTARRALIADRTTPPSTILPARPRPSEWPKPTDTPRPARWNRRLLLIGAPEAGLVAAPGKTALLRPALDSCPGSEEATVIVISGLGFHPLDEAGSADVSLAGPDALARLASDHTHQDRLRTLLGARDFDDILLAAQADYLALLDAHAWALPLCRTMERTRNTALQQRTHFRIWLDRGLSAGQTVGGGHIRWGKAVKGLTGRLGEFTARYAGKLPTGGHRIIVETADGAPADGFVTAQGEPLACETVITNRAHLRSAMATSLRAFGGATRLTHARPPSASIDGRNEHEDRKAAYRRIVTPNVTALRVAPST